MGWWVEPTLQRLSLRPADKDYLLASKPVAQVIMGYRVLLLPWLRLLFFSQMIL
jgi:hypothetical protein